MNDPMGPVHTAGNAVPPVDDELAGLLEDLTGIHAGVDLIRDGLRLLALDRLTPTQTQTVLYTLTGADGLDIATGIAHLVRRLTDADTNPSLRGLPLDQQKQIQHQGEQHAYQAAEMPRQHIAEAIAAIDHT